MLPSDVWCGQVSGGELLTKTEQNASDRHSAISAGQSESESWISNGPTEGRHFFLERM